jgi:hypothetical protein
MELHYVFLWVRKESTLIGLGKIIWDGETAP